MRLLTSACVTQCVPQFNPSNCTDLQHHVENVMECFAVHECTESAKKFCELTKLDTCSNVSCKIPESENPAFAYIMYAVCGVILLSCIVLLCMNCFPSRTNQTVTANDAGTDTDEDTNEDTNEDTETDVQPHAIV